MGWPSWYSHDLLESMQEQIEALVRANARLLKRVAELEERVRRLEGSPPESQPVESPPPETPPPPESPPQPEGPPQPESPPPPAAAPEPSPNLETQVGLTWLNRIAVVTCVFAVGFFFKYAADNNWIGPAARVGLGVGVGATIVLLAEVLFRRGHTIYAQGVTALGLGVLYLSFYAAHDFYDLIPQAAAFGCLAVVTALGGFLALRHGALAMAILALLSGYATPLLLAHGERHDWFYCGYLATLTAAAVLVARRRSWPELEGVAAMGTGILLFTLAVTGDGREKLPGALLAAAYYGSFSVSRSIAVFGAVHFLAVASAAYLLPQLLFQSLVSVVTAFSLWLAHKRAWTSIPVVSLWTITIGWLLWRSADHHYQQPSLVVLCFLTLWLAVFLIGVPSRKPLGLMVAAVASLLYLAAGLNELHGTPWRGLFTVAVAAVHLGRAYGLRNIGDASRLHAGLAVAYFSFAAPIQLAGFSLFMVWSAQAAILAWMAQRSRRVEFTAASVILLVLVTLACAFETAPVLSYTPLADHGIIVNRWFLTLLVAAIASWLASGWLLPVAGRFLCALIHINGHGLLLAALLVETLRWTKARETDSPASLATFASSLVITLYAAALVSLGVAVRTSLLRILGLCLLGAVIVKLYLIDVWNLRLLYRVFAFASLGALLLALSFLYSKYRASLERWIQNQPQD